MERYRTTIILLVLLVALGGLAFFLGGRGGNNGAGGATAVPTTPPAQYVWQDTNPVVGMDIVTGTQHVSLTKDISATTWAITAPISATADIMQVGSEADLLQNLQATDVITTPGDLAQFKLDKPALTLTVTFSDTAHTKRTLQVGGPLFDGSGYYTKLPDKGEVYIVGNSTIEPLRSWPETPPKFVPTPTPIPPTITPTGVVTGTSTITGTAVVTPQGLGTASSVGASSTITVTNPGAANPTTPLASPPVGTASP